MNLLYLSEDYSASKVHHELVSRISQRGIEVSVFSVVRLVDKGSDIRETYGRINYSLYTYSLSSIFEKPYKYLFGFKRRLKIAKLLSRIKVDNIDVIHAATLFSEGVVAYDLYRKFGIPYSVAVRGTDINFYLSKMPHLWKLGKKILKNASKIIFLSPIIKDKFALCKPIRGIYDDLVSKCIIVPNGIEDYWIDNRREKISIKKPDQLLYIGRFDKNKNVERLIKATLRLREKIPNVRLNLVGGGDVCHDSVLDYCSKYPDCINYLGRIYDKDQLIKVVRGSHVFAMVSHSETFGLVYLEALSQGLPIVYTAGQGVDGSVPKNVGESVDSRDIDDIYNKLERIFMNYDAYDSMYNEIDRFSWDHIADIYVELFKHVIN